MRVFVHPLPPAAGDAVGEGLRQGVAAAGHDVVDAGLRLPARAGVAAAERQDFLLLVDRMLEADLLVADASEPDHAVGWAVAWFLAKGRLVVLTCRRDARAGLSPMLAGNPSPWQRLVLYEGAEGLAEALAARLVA